MENHVIESKALISEAGRILIPVNMRKALHLNAGDEVLLRVEHEEMHVIPLFKAVNEAQEIVKLYNKKRLKLTDVLSEIREEDRDRE